MDESRDDIVQRFHEMAHLPHEVCLDVLQSHNWNLEEAIQHWLSQGQIVTESTAEEDDDNVHFSIDVNVNDSHFTINEVFSRTYGTVGNLKSSILDALRTRSKSQSFASSSSTVIIHNWPDGVTYVDDEKTFSSLGVSGQLNLRATVMLEETAGNSVATQNEPIQDLPPVQITVSSGDDLYEMVVPSQRSLGDLMIDTQNLTGIAADEQHWDGLPPFTHTRITLQELGLEPGSHHVVSVTQSPFPDMHTMLRPIPLVNVASHNVNGETQATSDQVQPVVERFSDEEDDDDYDDMSVSTSAGRGNQPSAAETSITLVSTDFRTDVEMTSQFATNFNKKYVFNSKTEAQDMSPRMSPPFSAVSLRVAVRDALTAPPNDRKLLAFYLHNNTSIFANIFASHVLSSPPVVDQLADKTVLYPWDCTIEPQVQGFWRSLGQVFGSAFVDGIKRMDAMKKLPGLMLVGGDLSQPLLLAFITGEMSLNECVTTIISAADQYRHSLETLIQRQNEQLMRELTRKEQEKEYKSSLEQDRVRSEQQARQQEEQDRAERQREDERNQRERRRKELQDSLPDEPSSDVPNADVVTFKIRLPAGSVLIRRFMKSDQFKSLLDFVEVKNFHPEQYKLYRLFPRTDLSTFDVTKTFAELKFVQQEQLVLQQLQDESE